MTFCRSCTENWTTFTGFCRTSTYSWFALTVGSAYQELDQQIIIQTNELTDQKFDEQIQCNVLKMHFRCNLDRIQIKFRCKSDAI